MFLVNNSHMDMINLCFSDHLVGRGDDRHNDLDNNSIFGYDLPEDASVK